MKKIALSFASIAMFAALALFATAMPARTAEAAPKTGFTLPERAIEVSPGLYKLGQAYDAKSDSMVEGYAFVHSKKSNAKSSAARPPKSLTCYAVMAAGAKWKSVEPWQVFPGAGLDEAFLSETLTNSIGAWEAAAGNSSILGNGSIGAGPVTDPYVLDDANQVSFGDLEDGTIAVTITWGTWGGPTANRKIIAWDQIYNTDYAWSASGEADKMDFWNIAMHELGHAMGLADIYTSGCSDVTMYGYGDLGQTDKRTLEAADVTGINLLY